MTINPHVEPIQPLGSKKVRQRVFLFVNFQEEVLYWLLDVWSNLGLVKNKNYKKVLIIQNKTEINQAPILLLSPWYWSPELNLALRKGNTVIDFQHLNRNMKKILLCLTAQQQNTFLRCNLLYILKLEVYVWNNFTSSSTLVKWFYLST